LAVKGERNIIALPVTTVPAAEDCAPRGFPPEETSRMICGV